MLLSLFRLLSRLPLGLLQAIGGVLGRVVYLLSGRYRERLRANLARAGLDADRLAWAAAAEAGKQQLETAWVWMRPRADFAARVSWADEPAMRRALDADRALILLTPHLGSFEAIAQAYALRPEARTRPMTVLYRRPRKAALVPLVERGRERDGLLLAPADLRGVRMLIKAVRSKQAAGILPDQVPSQGDGVWAPFFGAPAYTMTLPGRLASAGAATVLVMGGERLPRGRGFRIHAEPVTEELTGDPVHDATAINRAVERMVLCFPLQYLWGYNRYKCPSGMTRPDVAAAAGP